MPVDWLCRVGVLESGVPRCNAEGGSVGGTCLLPAGLCCWMLTSSGLGVTARISLQLSADEAKSIPTLPAPCHLQALANKQTNKTQGRKDMEPSMKKTALL